MSQQLIQTKVAKKLEVNAKAADRIVNAVLEAIREGIIEDSELRLEPIGTFKHVPRKARTGRNFQTGEPVKIPAGYDVELNVYSDLLADVRALYNVQAPEPEPVEEPEPQPDLEPAPEGDAESDQFL